MREVPPYVWLLSIALSLQFMSGQAAGFGLPIAPDRLLTPIALFLMWRAEPDARRTWRPVLVHAFMALSVLWVVASLIVFDGLTSSVAMFNLLDAFGVVPFILFLVAPIAYCSVMRRRTLLIAFSALGLYLGLVALFQGLHLESLVFPRYIVDPGSSHFGRAFGPSLQVGSNGLQLFACTGCAAILAATSRGGLRLAAASVTTLCTFGLFLTMTRSIWLGSLIGAMAALSLSTSTRRWILRGLVTGALLVATLLVVSPALQVSVQMRLNDSQSGFDRLNAANAALRVLENKPLLGIGFSEFPQKEADWFWQGDTTPVAATGIAVHNVLLGLAAELGIPGMALWLATLVLASRGMWRPLPDQAERRMWRQLVVGYVLCWLTVGTLLPISYALPSSLLWVFLGLVARPYDLGFRAKAKSMSQIEKELAR